MPYEKKEMTNVYFVLNFINAISLCGVEIHYHVFADFSNDLLENDGSCGGRENKTKVKIECISCVELVIDANWVAQKLFTKQWSVDDTKIAWIQTHALQIKNEIVYQDMEWVTKFEYSVISK